MRTENIDGQDAGNSTLLRVLTYHRVADPCSTPHLNPRLVSALPDVFAQQMMHLASHYNVVSMETAYDSIINSNRLPKRAVLITFDDAYADFIDIAWPVLKNLELPATVFVPTAYPDHNDLQFWWDRLYSAISGSPCKSLSISPLGDLPLDTPKSRLKSLKVLQDHFKSLSHTLAADFLDEACKKLGERKRIQKTTLNWEQLRTLNKEGVTLCPHTRTHPLLTRVTPDVAREEIRGSCQDMENALGELLPVFAYPNGDHNEHTASILKEEGIKVAFSCRDGLNNIHTVDPLRICRTNITRRTSPYLFRLRMYNWFTYIDRFRH